METVSVNFRMWKEVLLIVGVVGGTTTQQNSVSSCPDECARIYSLHTNPYEQISPAWRSCLGGCELYTNLDERVGDAPIFTLKNCNYSCDEKFRGEDVKACQAGCGFNYDIATAQIDPSPRIEEFPAPSSQPVFLPRMFEQISRTIPRIMQRTFSNSFDDEDVDFNFSMPSIRSFASFPSMPSFSSLPSLPRLPQGILGRKDVDDDTGAMFEDFFGSAMNQVNNILKSIPGMPSLDSLSSLPMGGSNSHGKLTVINAGPGGFVEEKHYNIGPDGSLVEEKHYNIGPDGTLEEVQEDPAHMDALEHTNPLDSNFNESDAEVFALPEETLVPEEALVPERVEVSDNEAPVEDTVDSAPLVESEPELRIGEAINPFFSVLKNSLEAEEKLRQDMEDTAWQKMKMEEKMRQEIEEKMKEEIYNKYNLFRNFEFRDASCSSDNLRWSDWVACVHVRLGVPRWLTAATIALGVIFSVWLCLIIPTSAPKQRIRSLVIKAEKLSLPSTIVSKSSKAKEAEANATNENVIAVIKVDLPPSYNEVTPGSPAPSYKSEMNQPIPGSPAPSYKSVDIPVKDEKTSNEKESVA